RAEVVVDLAQRPPGCFRDTPRRQVRVADIEQHTLGRGQNPQPGVLLHHHESPKPGPSRLPRFSFGRLTDNHGALLHCLSRPLRTMAVVTVSRFWHQDWPTAGPPPSRPRSRIGYRITGAHSYAAPPPYAHPRTPLKS